MPSVCTQQLDNYLTMHENAYSMNTNEHYIVQTRPLAMNSAITKTDKS